MRASAWPALLAAALVACAGAPAIDQGSSPAAAGRWESAPPMLYARAAHAVASEGSVVYAVGGTGPQGRPVLAVERFAGRRWSEVATLPGEGLNAPAAVMLGGRLFVIGGFGTTTNVPTARVHVFDPASARWQEAAPLPAPRGGHAAAVVGGRIHVIGGGNDRRTLADHSVYDPAAGAWQDRAPLPRSMGSPAAVVHDGGLWSVGGRSGPEDFGDVLRYDAAADAWRPMPSIPPRGTVGAVSVCGAIHAFGGESQPRQAVLGDALRLDGAAWTPLPAMPTPRNFARAVAMPDASVLVVGGSTAVATSHAPSGSAVMERFRPSCAR